MSPPRSRFSASYRSTPCRALALAWVLMLPIQADADGPQALTLSAVVKRAMDQHPAVRGARAELDAAEASRTESAWDLAPDAWLGGEVALGTGNVVVGPMFPMAGVPAVSGPAVDPEYSGAAQSQVALTASWGVSDLPARIARLDAAIGTVRAEEDDLRAAEVRAGFNAAIAYVDVVEAEADEAVAMADLEWYRAAQRQADALATAQVRPGADRALAAAGTAAAEQRLIEAHRKVAVAHARLAAAIGDAGADVTVIPADLDRVASPSDADPSKSPSAAAARYRSEAAASAVRAERAAYLPRVSLVGAAWSRGGGWPPPADASPVVPNWAVGATLSWSILDLPAVRAHVRGAKARADGASAHLAEIELQVQEQVREASAARAAAQAALALAPARVEAAATARAQADARYAAGLTDLVEVEHAQFIESGARRDAAHARSDVARAALVLAYALGDLSIVTEGSP